MEKQTLETTRWTVLYMLIVKGIYLILLGQMEGDLLARKWAIDAEEILKGNDINGNLYL